MESKIILVRDEFTAELNKAENSADLEAIRVKYLGKKGPVTELMKEMKDLSPEEKKAFGQEISLRAEMINSAKEMEKRYQKLKQKNVKKGKPEYSMEDFAKLIKKETNLKGYKAVAST